MIGRPRYIFFKSQESCLLAVCSVVQLYYQEGFPNSNFVAPNKRPAATRVPLPPMEKASKIRRSSGKEKKNSSQHDAGMTETKTATPATTLESQPSAVSEGVEKFPTSAPEAVCTDSAQVYAQEPHTFQPKATAKPAPKKRLMLHIGAEKPQEENAVAKTHENDSAKTPSMEATTLMSAGPRPSPSRTGAPGPEAIPTDSAEETVGEEHVSAFSEQSRYESMS